MDYKLSDTDENYFIQTITSFVLQKYKLFMTFKGLKIKSILIFPLTHPDTIHYSITILQESNEFSQGLYITLLIRDSAISVFVPNEFYNTFNKK